MLVRLAPDLHLRTHEDYPHPGVFNSGGRFRRAPATDQNTPRPSGAPGILRGYTGKSRSVLPPRCRKADQLADMDDAIRVLLRQPGWQCCGVAPRNAVKARSMSDVHPTVSDNVCTGTVVALPVCPATLCQVKGFSRLLHDAEGHRCANGRIGSRVEVTARLMSTSRRSTTQSPAQVQP